jgi:hypothetical protein
VENQLDTADYSRDFGNIPEKFHQFLSNRPTYICDRTAKKVIAVGFEIVAKMGDDLFQELGQLGQTYYDVPSERTVAPKWYFLTYTASREALANEFGPITQEAFGPRGGWKSVSFGGIEFTSKLLKSDRGSLPVGHPVVVRK